MPTYQTIYLLKDPQGWQRQIQRRKKFQCSSVNVYIYIYRVQCPLAHILCPPIQRQRQRQSIEKTQHVLYFWKAEGSRMVISGACLVMSGSVCWCLGHVWWCLVHVWWCLVVSDACLMVSRVVWWCLVMSGGVWWCLMHVWWSLMHVWWSLMHVW